MSENSKMGEQESAPSKDALLELLIQFSATETPVNIGVTLTVGGLLVSGNIVSHRQYFIQFDALLKANGAISDMLSDPDISQSPKKLNFIHLSDASFSRPGQNPIPTSGGVLWRGKLADVDGFHLGVLKSSSTDE